jgi:hypothetical protein
VVRENHLDFLDQLYRKGVPLVDEDIALLKKHGFIKEEKYQPAGKEDTSLKDYIKDDFLKTTGEQREHDQDVDILFDDKQGTCPQIVFSEELEERRKKGGYLFEGRNQEINRQEWMPESLTNHAADFVEWIDSINFLGFKKKTNYRKFNLYVQQAYTWLNEKTEYTEHDNEEDLDDYRMEELRRCYDNTLYFLNKYVYYKEGDDESGRVKYVAAPAHEVMAYLNDCGYSVALLKARQIAATTTLMSCDVKDVVFKRNHFMKFITEDQEKAEEIFEDKLKYAFSQLPYWMKPDVINERDNLFKLGKKDGKGEKKGVNSRILVVPPKRTAVAGGAPQKVKIDEAGNIGILSVMINNARPTMLWFNPKTKKLEIKRQLWFWGTGGEMEKGGAAFQSEFMAIVNQWKDRNFDSCIIPLFLDWTARPGATQEDYDREKRVAYSKVGLDLKKSIIEFHQSWPLTMSDAFMTSDRTLVDTDFINTNIERIRTAKSNGKFQIFQRGYFEPVYDYTAPTDENSDVPFKIIGANFVPTTDIDERASTIIFMHPEHDWNNRYFQGTDPISSDTGLSNMASAIWDKHLKTVSAVMDFRTKDYRYVFLQSTLLGLYYDTKNEGGVNELVESNIGQSYTQYKEGKGCGNKMTLNYELPPYLQNRTTVNEGVGIDNRGLRNMSIINRLHELIQSYGDKNYMEVFWEQLKTFVCNVSEKSGKEMWGPTNRKLFKDDVLFAVVYSYICAELCQYPEPESLKQEEMSYEIRYETMYDAQFNLVMVPVKRMVSKHGRIIQ